MGAIGGPILTNPDSPKFSRLVGLLPEESLCMVPYGFIPHDLLYTRNAAYRRSVLAEVGLFNETLVAAEDPELNYRIENAGYDLIFLPRMMVFHHHRCTLTSYIRQHFRNGVGCGQDAKINRRICHTGLKLAGAVGLALGIFLLVVLVLSRLSTILYPVIAMASAYLCYCINHVRPVYTRTRSIRDTIGALVLAVVWPPFFALELLWELTKSAGPVIGTLDPIQPT